MTYIPQFFGPYPPSNLGSNITAYADNEISTANNYILKLGELTASLTPQTISPVFPVSPSAPAVETAQAPSLQTIVWTAPAVPSAFTGSLSVDQYLPQPFDDMPPVLSFGSAPTPFSDTAPASPGINTDFVYPELTVNLPSAPSLLSLNTYSFNGINLPTITQDIPTLDLAAPSIREYVPGSLYTSSLLQTLQTQLQDRIQNGGTALPPEVETALWNRGRDREYRQVRDALADLERMETLGFAFPPGVYIDARVKIQTEMGYNSANISREIMIKQAELELTNILKSLDTATQLEGQMINYANSVEQRLFESCKYATQAGIEIYNAQVRSYAAYLDAYKTKVAIYEAQIRGELAKVEAYKAEIEAEQAKAQINTALVQQYKTQADVALASVEVYKAQIAAIQSKAEIEKLKVEIFGEQVRAFGAKVNAYTAGVEGFRASIQAETSKQEAFRSQVEAYSAQVSAAAKIAETKIEEYKGKITAKNAEWEGYKAQANAEAARVQAIASTNSSVADLYRAQVTGLASFNETLTKQWQAVLDQNQKTVEIGVQAAKANAELYTTTRGLAMDGAKVGAQVSAQLGAAALNAVNYSTSANWSAGFSQGNSSTWSESYSISSS